MGIPLGVFNRHLVAGPWFSVQNTELGTWHEDLSAEGEPPPGPGSGVSAVGIRVGMRVRIRVGIVVGGQEA